MLAGRNGQVDIKAGWNNRESAGDADEIDQLKNHCVLTGVAEFKVHPPVGVRREPAGAGGLDGRLELCQGGSIRGGKIVFTRESGEITAFASAKSSAGE